MPDDTGTALAAAEALEAALNAQTDRCAGAVAQLAARIAGHVDQIQKRLDALTARIEAWESPPPAPELLVAAPPWPTDAIYRGAAPRTTNVTSDGPTTAVTLRPRTEGDSSSDGHDVHVLLPRRIYHYTWQIELNPDVAMLDALTWKVGGMAAFDGNWAAWPGGGTSAGAAGTTNAMERLVGQNTSAGRAPGLARWGIYCTFPVPVAEIPAGKDGVTADVGGASAWVTNRGHTCHWHIPGWPVMAGRWTRHTRTVDVAGGTLIHSIDGQEALVLTGLPWAEGFNRVYQSFMIGGSDPSFLPRTGDRTGRVAYRNYRLWAV